MSYAQNVWLYFVLLFGIIVVPGMDMFLVIANSLTGGRRRGAAALAGIMLGGVVHTLFGALGVSAIVAAVPQLLTVILVAGAAYLAWIGITLMRSAIVVDDIGAATPGSPVRVFRQGLITCLLNPKAYLFVIAVFPQFIRPEYGPVWRQAMVMGALTLATQFVVYGSIGQAAASSRRFLTSRPHFTMWIGRGAGAVFIVAAALTLANGLGFL